LRSWSLAEPESAREISEHIFTFVKRNYARLSGLLDHSSPFNEVISEFVERHGYQMGTKRKWAETEKSLERLATVSEIFNNITITKYYSMRLIGQFIRLLDDSIRIASSTEELEKTRTAFLDELRRLNTEVKKETECEVIPIQKLVRVQVGAALWAVDRFFHRSS